MLKKVGQKSFQHILLNRPDWKNLHIKEEQKPSCPMFYHVPFLIETALTASVKSVPIRNYPRPCPREMRSIPLYSVHMRTNTDQNNFEYGHPSRSPLTTFLVTIMVLHCVIIKRFYIYTCFIILTLSLSIGFIHLIHTPNFPKN